MTIISFRPDVPWSKSVSSIFVENLQVVPRRTATVLRTCWKTSTPLTKDESKGAPIAVLPGRSIWSCFRQRHPRFPTDIEFSIMEFPRRQRDRVASQPRRAASSPGINVIFTLSLARNEIDSNREISKNLFPPVPFLTWESVCVCVCVCERERDEFREQLSSPAVCDVHTTGRRIPPGTYARRCRCNLVSRREIARK